MAPLHCELKVINFKSYDFPPYEALSYTWGGQSPSSALQLFRPSGRLPLRLWAYAVCIDNDEKASQIALVADIYRMATRVQVWLGAMEHDVEVASRVLAAIRWRHFKARAALSAEPGFKDAQKLQTLVGDLYRETEADEAMMSVMAMNHLWQTHAAPTFPKTSNVELKFDERERAGIVGLIDAFDHFKCADDRDRIYALGALAVDMRPPGEKSADPYRSWEDVVLRVEYDLSVRDA
ncbi:hypothetical protein F4679DRAFT_582579 [Xylaria curta]|nr:hypothetical protein F4679DRAFT_582579 [Xylaria curta]